MKNITATILGFIVAPLVPSIYSALATPITRQYHIFTQLPLILVVYLYVLPFIIILGVPAFLLAHHFRIIRWWSALGAGILIGVIVVIVIHLPRTPEMHDFMINCPLGAAAGLTFWLIWKQGQGISENNGDKTL